MTEAYACLITWNTYGTWLPGDARGWRKRSVGDQAPRPLLERWSREQMTGEGVLLSPSDRETVVQACREHCKHRGWKPLAINARSNHVHVVIISDVDPKKARDQLKANCTRRLRAQDQPLCVKRAWARGGDIELLKSEDHLERAVEYVIEAQDRKGVEN